MVIHEEMLIVDVKNTENNNLYQNFASFWRVKDVLSIIRKYKNRILILKIIYYLLGFFLLLKNVF